MAHRDVQLPRRFRSTHDTAGLSGFPAVDVFGQPGEPVRAPEAGNLVDVHQIPWDQGQRVGGTTAYLQGADGNTYFLTHLGGDVAAGPVKAGEPIGQVGTVPGGWWQPHIHEGLHQGVYQPGSSGQASVSASVPSAPASPVPAALAQPHVQPAARTPLAAALNQPSGPDTHAKFVQALLGAISPGGQLNPERLMAALASR